ncbi:hypothetical protein PsorP6_013847 [Peronosclerospora sorghi]|uniref:Uncharacterized protein n=1 Tax=Peronosclerospora sorghi TaxID=230839 RepID=A0ACC0VJ70_9STRA|nr:hypothetical protein PsorP6_013847 [Peronosclerospora sorghi]
MEVGPPSLWHSLPLVLINHKLLISSTMPLEEDNPILHDPGYWKGRRFYSAEAGEKELQAYAARNGYVLTRRRSKNDRKGDLAKIVLKCGLGDSYRDRGNRVGMGRRKCKTRCRNCSFSATVRRKEGSFYVTFEDSTHNHNLLDLRLFSQARLSSVSEDMKQRILVMLDNCVPTPKILSMIQNPLLVFKDIENMRSERKRDELQGSSPMEALVHRLEKEDYVFFRIKMDFQNRCASLFLIPEKTRHLTEQYHTVLQVDSTYNTDMYRMPLMHIVCMTATNQSFSIGFCFMSQ